MASSDTNCGADSELLDRIGVGAYRLSADGQLLATNSCLALLLAVDPNAAMDLEAVPNGTIATSGCEAEHEWLTGSGSTVRVRDVRRAVHDETGNLVGFEGVVTPLGGASAYTALEARLAQLLPGPVALLRIDVTRFRDVNELLGQRVGEELTCKIEARLMRQVPAGGMLAHTGGSQFAVLVPGADSHCAEEVAATLITAIEQPFVLNGIDIFIGASIGVALAPAHGRTVAELTQSADAALYLSRASNHPGYVVYDVTAGVGVHARAELASDLRRALDRGELELFYQPQVTLAGEVRALEALLRWRHPERGLLVPKDFMDIAEETGLIVPIGGWVLDEACRRCVAWNHDRKQPIKVCVNISALQFYFSDLAEVVSATLHRTGLPAHLLELELTETVLLRDTRKCSQDLEEIRRLGVTVAIDDFGTGYSSLGYLRNLPVDVVKIDRSYVEDLQPGAMPALVGAITSMAHGLGLQVVAEGIERTDQMDVLRSLSVDLVQGYLFGRPRRLSDADPV